MRITVTAIATRRVRTVVVRDDSVRLAVRAVFSPQPNAAAAAGSAGNRPKAAARGTPAVGGKACGFCQRLRQLADTSRDGVRSWLF
jgi:hypothetical protein